MSQPRYVLRSSSSCSHYVIDKITGASVFRGPFTDRELAQEQVDSLNRDYQESDED